MEWYRVTKTIKGRKYDYWQKTYRVGDSVKTLNQYIGPNANPPRRPSMKSVMANKTVEYSPLKARIKKHAAMHQAARRKTRGLKAVNPYIAILLKK